MRLRLKLYPASFLLALACCGCFSVEFQTAVNRRGGGTRTVEIVMAPMMAGLYKKTDGTGKLFNIPGQGLQAKSEVKLTGSAKTELDDGSLKLSWNYRADRVELFSDGDDSVKFKITKSGLWVYYEYLEIISASKPEPAAPAAGQDIYWIRHKLVMPGQIVGHNSDSITPGGLVWNRSLGQVTAAGLTMEARSRELNPLYLLLAGISLLAAGGSLCWHRRKSLQKSQ
ncbi:hypothetical protein HY768_04715 [candidate division TA06 bacterium]|uniref:LPXTG cell wall anchor domain-containing protein n=1 Tax=candidate division TA06 bacterium TaxID=2250710 RepID=A0A933MKK8_UNCT6|nr:hypothetical protein [candidate division TA06 bacterium]